MNRLVLQLDGDRSVLPSVADEIEAFCAREQVPKPVEHALQIALDELLFNTVSYGFEGIAEPRIDLIVECPDPETVRVEVADNGNAFDPNQAPEPDLESDVEDRAVGGLGVYLVKKLMDDMVYERREDRNVITLVKRFGDAEQSPQS